ncbi:hypothetical protein [Amycolatopsis sp. NPDC006125]|uniref:hypothetical protein n=1 Tax=Amycolatopsis sp. NPDC006125 TaxID=3156730 RepID=UPI0033A77694
MSTDADEVVERYFQYAHNGYVMTDDTCGIPEHFTDNQPRVSAPVHAGAAQLSPARNGCNGSAFRCGLFDSSARTSSPPFPE